MRHGWRAAAPGHAGGLPIGCDDAACCVDGAKSASRPGPRRPARDSPDRCRPLLDSRRNAATHTGIADGQASAAVPPPAADSVDAPTPHALDGVVINSKGIGNDDPGDVHVAVSLDFPCPYCAKVEQANGPVLERLIAQGGVTVVYHPLAVLDRFSTNTLDATRTANAAATVAHGAGGRLLPFLSALFAHQPKENTPGLTDAPIVDAAREADGLFCRGRGDAATMKTRSSPCRIRSPEFSHVHR